MNTRFSTFDKTGTENALPQHIHFFCKQAVKLAIASVLMLVGGAVNAAPVTIDNYSFESPAYNDGGFGYTATGWVVTGSSGVWNPTSSQMGQGPTDGLQVGYSNQNGLGLSQTLSAVLTANTNYTLMVDVLSRTDGYTHKSSILELRTADDIVLASASIGAIAGGSNGLLTASYMASASDANLGKNLKIALLAGGGQSDWDNVRLDASSAVPLPATAWLLGSGLLGLAGWARRKIA